MATGALSAYLEELRAPVPEPPLEPCLDDIDEKVDSMLREQMDLQSGAIRKGVTEPGEGTESPTDGCLVYFHLSVKKQDGSVLQTTRPDQGGSGVPCAFVLGKGRRAPRGWELALEGMRRGERAVLQVSPEYSYAQPGCSLPPPPGVPPDAALLLDVQLLRWYGPRGVRAVGEAGVVKRTTRETESWEKPVPPFEVEVALAARLPSSGGRQGEGAPYFRAPREQPLRFTLGGGQVPAGLEEGVAAMARGEAAFLSCPAAPGDPAGLVPPPPGGAERVEFEAELLRMVQVRDLTGTGEVTKRRLREGRGEFPVDCPLEDNAVRVHFTATLSPAGQVVFDSRGPAGDAPPLEFDTGTDAVPEAVDMCVRLMTPGELASARSAPQFAYQGRADRPAACPEDAAVAFEIELLSFEPTPNWHAMGAGDKLARAEALRLQGNRVFKAGRLRFARQKYLRALKLLDGAYDAESDAQLEALSAAKANCQANLALLCQKEEDYSECFSWCDKALRENPDHPKALYRRGTTHAILGNYEAAEADLRHARAADPGNAAEIERELARMHQRRRTAATRERAELRSFFDRTKS